MLLFLVISELRRKNRKKIESHQDLALVLTQVLKTSAKVIPILVRDLEAQHRILDLMTLIGIDTKNTH